MHTQNRYLDLVHVRRHALSIKYSGLFYGSEKKKVVLHAFTDKSRVMEQMWFAYSCIYYYSCTQKKSTACQSDLKVSLQGFRQPAIFFHSARNSVSLNLIFIVCTSIVTGVLVKCFKLFPKNSPPKSRQVVAETPGADISFKSARGHVRRKFVILVREYTLRQKYSTIIQVLCV